MVAGLVSPAAGRGRVARWREATALAVGPDGADGRVAGCSGQQPAGASRTGRVLADVACSIADGTEVISDSG
jgi:hypothetical protein